MPIIGTLPNNIQNGQAVDANPVMADFNYIVNQVNANANPLGTLTAPSGTRVIFQQATAPLGWTADASVTDHTLQLTAASGSVSTTGNGYTGMFNAAWTSDGHALTIAELAVHTHSDAGHTHGVNEGAGHNHGAAGGNSFVITGGGPNGNAAGGALVQSTAATAQATTGLTINTGNASIQNTGSGAAHTHTKTFNVNVAQGIVGVKS